MREEKAGERRDPRVEPLPAYAASPGQAAQQGRSVVNQRAAPRPPRFRLANRTVHFEPGRFLLRRMLADPDVREMFPFWQDVLYSVVSCRLADQNDRYFEPSFIFNKFHGTNKSKGGWRTESQMILAIRVAHSFRVCLRKGGLALVSSHFGLPAVAGGANSIPHPTHSQNGTPEIY